MIDECMYLVAVLTFQCLETIVSMPEMSTVNDMVVITDLRPNEVIVNHTLAGLSSLSS